MYGHKRFDDTNASPDAGPGFPVAVTGTTALGGASPRTGGRPRQRMGGRLRLARRRHGAFGPGFSGPRCSDAA